MSLVDKVVFERRGAKGCSDSEYVFSMTTCCERVGIIDPAMQWSPRLGPPSGAFKCSGIGVQVRRNWCSSAPESLFKSERLTAKVTAPLQ